jgi:hypothetical protein
VPLEKNIFHDHLHDQQDTRCGHCHSAYRGVVGGWGGIHMGETAHAVVRKMKQRVYSRRCVGLVRGCAYVCVWRGRGGGGCEEGEGVEKETQEESIHTVLVILYPHVLYLILSLDTSVLPSRCAFHRGTSSSLVRASYSLS